MGTPRARLAQDAPGLQCDLRKRTTMEAKAKRGHVPWQDGPGRRAVAGGAVLRACSPGPPPAGGRPQTSGAQWPGGYRHVAGVQILRPRPDVTAQGQGRMTLMPPRA